MADTQARHKPGVFKQPNKIHKTGRHRSKGKLQKEANGRVNVKVATKTHKTALRKAERLNRSQQIRKQKREEVLAKKRGRDGQGSAPVLVSVVPLCAGLDPQAALDRVTGCLDEITPHSNDLGVAHFSVPRFKQRFAFMVPQYGDMYGLLDAAKVSDSIVFLLSPEFGVDSLGEHCLSCLFAQGMPSCVLTVQGLDKLPSKKQSELKKKLHKQMKKRFPDLKLHGLDSSQDAMLLLRTVADQKQKNVIFRDNRPHLLAEELAFELTDENLETGTLKVTGYLRGRSLSANGLVHLPGWDTYQIHQITAARDPNSTTASSRKHKQKTDEEMSDVEDATQVLDRADALRQTSLQSEVVPDPMEGEQTWPTEEELAAAEMEFRNKTTKKVKRVPKGTSEYQAAWIVESEEEDDDDEDDDEEDDSDDDVEDDAMSEDDEDEMSDSNLSQHDTESVTIEADAEKYDKTVNFAEDQEMLEKLKSSRLDQMFPDEMDTPREVSARQRFQRYRGLKSFRTSKWDPHENLPMEYARIFQFENFKRSKKRAMAESENSGALPGWYVTIHVADVPKAFMEEYREGSPVVLCGLLDHEQKMSVNHFLLKRNLHFTQPVRSKERLIFHVGFRRFSACPIYSQHTNSDKHKFEHYLQDVTVATVFAPVMFPPAPILVFKEGHHGQHELVAQGSILSVNPDRMIIKRIVLSGHPFKINKKLAVVRYMFFNREDILWFKPVELRTKWGRRGHIREPLGTHGHMKCIFDNQLKSQDTVMMNLYKRVYPKWTYNTRVVSPGVSTIALPSVMDTSSEDNFSNEYFD